MNVMQVTHTEREFFFAFGQISPQNVDVGMAHMISLLVTSPEHAKEIMKVLQESIRKYEATFGPIAERKAQSPQRIQ